MSERDVRDYIEDVVHHIEKIEKFVGNITTFEDFQQNDVVVYACIVVIHAYFGIDEQIVWKSIQEELPNIKPVFQDILQELKRHKTNDIK